MSILGIDPGLNGGLVVLDNDGSILFKSVMPTLKLKATGKTKTVLDLPTLHQMLKKIASDYAPKCCLEKVSARPGQGVSSMFSFGYVFGCLEMCLVANQIPYTLVPPQTWCKEMHQGLSKDIDAKDRSLLVFKRQYPGVDLRTSERCTNHHDGLIDALLLAAYGLKQKG